MPLDMPSNAAADIPADPTSTGATDGVSAALLPGKLTLPLLERLPSLGDITCVILHGGCVFEFSGPFPSGTIASGYYNLNGSKPGFHGHLSLDAMTRVRFQDRPHRGRASYAFVFEDAKGRCLFKVFLGRDSKGEVYASQLQFFQELRATHQIPAQETLA
jgi:putative heme utilization carrier protein HutX